MESNEVNGGSRPQSSRKSNTPSRRESRAPSPSQATKSRPSSARPSSRSASRPSSASARKDKSPSETERPTSANGNREAGATVVAEEPTVAAAQPANQPPQSQSDVTLVLRPICDDWRMAPDEEVSVPYNSSFFDLCALLEETRGICKYRIQIRYKSKIIPPNREKWTLRRMGVTDGTLVQIEPTLVGSWWWLPVQHYIESFSKQIEDIIEETPDKGIFLHELAEKIQSPPPIKQSLRIFLRSYPERFHMHCNTAVNTYWIRKTKGMIDIPVFQPVPHNLGTFKHFKMRDFDWHAYKDIDDKYKVEVFESVEEASARIEEQARLLEIEKRKKERESKRATKVQNKKSKAAASDGDSEAQESLGTAEKEVGEEEGDDEEEDDLDEEEAEGAEEEEEEEGLADNDEEDLASGIISKTDPGEGDKREADA